ncbi:hypothetical protein TNCV_2292961 [Trichonephila clavipes]|nr:hypothetical protein TNCV_2292961 [Trichonephila clavipes]
MLHHEIDCGCHVRFASNEDVMFAALIDDVRITIIIGHQRLEVTARLTVACICVMGTVNFGESKQRLCGP